jgi:predicted homoserine dehydrogenase-like protein
VVATAKFDLAAGDELDGEGGYKVWGKLMPATDSLAVGGLPIGLAHGVRLKRPVAQGAPVTWDDIEAPAKNDAVAYRRRMEQEIAPA